MPAEENKAIIHQFYEEGVTKGNLGIFDEFMEADYVDHFFPPELPPGLEGLKLFVGALRTGFPDVQITVEDVIAEQDKAASRITIRGTQTGQFQGRPPTGKQVTLEALDHWRFTGGKVVEHWGGPNQFSLLHQLGVVSLPE